MRKIIVLLAALSLVAMAVPAFAGITGTAHELTQSGSTGCAVCHLPHAGKGARLWVTGESTDNRVQGVTSGLCAYCHMYDLVGDANAGANYVYDLESHGYAMSIAEIPSWLATPEQADLPYTTAAKQRNANFMECTSCHDVHDNTDRPFLQANIDALCIYCHQDRFTTDGGATWEVGTGSVMGAWGAANAGLNNPGSHPVGTDVVDGDFSGTVGESPVVIRRFMDLPYGANAQGLGYWHLGGHLTGGTAAGVGGVSCVTCHAVHGVLKDVDDLVITWTNYIAFTPVTSMLAADQSTGITFSGIPTANGEGYYNQLCEACHVGVAPDAAYNVVWAWSGVTYDVAGSFHAPNPGGRSWGHPVDDMEVSDQGWVTAYPNADWPVGRGYGNNASTNGIVCESCHVTHGYADRARSDMAGVASTTEYILRGTADGICSECHTASIAQHHPVGITYTMPGSGAASYLANVTAGADNFLSCQTCHGGGGGAHNWTGFQSAGLDAAWKPLDNARFVQVADSMSQTCMDCHLNLTGAFRISPTANDGLIAGLYDPSADFTDYELMGDGSHFIGAFPNDATYMGTSVMNPQIPGANFVTGNWGAVTGTTGSISRFAGTGDNTGTQLVLVCESCHELEPAKNDTQHLLLANFSEQEAGGNTLCQYCHSPTGTHPMTGQWVTRANRGLTQDPAGIPWLRTPLNDTNIDQEVGVADPNGWFNCDSCHQVHDANTASTTYIIEADAGPYGAATVSVGLGPDTPARKILAGTAYATANSLLYLPQVYDGKQVNTSGWCNECHPYQ